MNELKFAWRQLLNNPGFTAVAVLTLALGIGANTALFSVVNGVLLRPLSFDEPERLVTLWESSHARGFAQLKVSPPTFRDWQAQSRAFEALAFWTGPFDFNLMTSEGLEKVPAVYASSKLFDAMRVEPLLGRGFFDEEDLKEGPQTAVISHALWQERFGGDPQVLGRSLTVDTYGRRVYTIVGVMPPGFHFPDQTELWLPAGWNDLPQDRREGHWLNVIARLDAETTLAAARSELNAIQARIEEANPGVRVGSEVEVVPLLKQMVGHNIRTGLLVLWAVVGGVLLISCANVANLMLARASSRQKEIALRLALGAARWRIARQMLVESVVLALAGGAAGALLAVWGTKAFVAASPAPIPRLAEVTVDAAALWFTLGAAVLTGIVFGLLPAWQGSRQDLNKTLKEGSRGLIGTITAGRTRQVLIVAEVALATLLLASAGLMLQSLGKLLRIDRGFQPFQIVTAELDFSVSGFTTWIRPSTARPQVKLQELLERLSQLPGVHAAGAAYRFLRLDNGGPSQTFSIFGRPVLQDSERPTAEHNAVTPDYLRALGITLLRGRNFTEADSLQAPGVALVNESFVRRYFPHSDPLGQRITMEGEPGALGATNAHGLPVWSEIVGVVSDVKSLGPRPETVPEIYRPYWQWPMQNPTLYVRAALDAGALAAMLRREIKSVIPSLPAPRIQSLSERVKESIAQPRFQAGLLSLFGGLALLLALCGIYGLLACTVAQRQREIGVRMALGARRSHVLWQVASQGMKWVFAGMFLGALTATAAARAMQSMLFQVKPADPITYAAVALLFGLTALAACLIPAGRAAAVNPTEALRCE